ncbi:MAG: bifunctional methylenetetrahydrofolate dehydrogenase/methenyltetrahydrofolate cyclohydrolase FolD [Prochlorotrichaceae cyanobacterium]|jgi:methylenetetrahydrofolate dehydrogenase (NADP+)/methenyltetrahydrofolate cyclohydrolase
MTHKNPIATTTVAPTGGQILDGKALSLQIQETLKAKVFHLTQQGNRSPGLAVIMIGDNPASAVYVRNKERASTTVGIISTVHHLPETVSQLEVSELIEQLNRDDAIDGILLQLPIPDRLDPVSLLYQIHPDKDVDGLHPLNLGRLVRGEKGLRSCTPAGVIRLLEAYDIPLEGQQVLMIGCSILVGKPMSLMLLEKEATVTIAHIKTQDLPTLSREADIIIVAAGCPNLVQADMVKPGAVVVDVGINRITSYEGKSRIVGDVDFDRVRPLVDWITPVPGGVGPMTVAMLLENTVWSYEQRLKP